MEVVVVENSLNAYIYVCVLNVFSIDIYIFLLCVYTETDAYNDVFS